jgi:hypothetical protein
MKTISGGFFSRREDRGRRAAAGKDRQIIRDIRDIRGSLRSHETRGSEHHRFGGDVTAQLQGIKTGLETHRGWTARVRNGRETTDGTDGTDSRKERETNGILSQMRHSTEIVEEPR